MRSRLSSDASVTPMWGLDAEDLFPLLALEVSDGVEGDGGAGAAAPEVLDVFEGSLLVGAHCVLEGPADALPDEVLPVPGEVVAEFQG